MGYRYHFRVLKREILPFSKNKISDLSNYKNGKSSVKISDGIFPRIDTVTSAPALDDFRCEWYTKHVIAMQETNLSKEIGDHYRFIWLRTFHHPIMVRISWVDQECKLVVKQLSGLGGYEPGQLTHEESRTLSYSEREKFYNLINETRFWKPQPVVDGSGLDGAQWILEGYRDHNYHIWDIWSPRSVPQFELFYKTCRYMLNLSNLKIPAKEVY